MVLAVHPVQEVYLRVAEGVPVAVPLQLLQEKKVLLRQLMLRAAQFFNVVIAFPVDREKVAK